MNITDTATYSVKFLTSYSVIIINNLVVMAIIAYKIKFGHVKIPHGRFLVNGIVFAMMVSFIDLYWKWTDAGPLTISQTSALWVNTLYFVMLHFMYFYIFLYFYALVSNIHLNDTKILAIMVPTIFSILLNFLNVRYHILFSITPDSKYVRESFYALEYVVPYIYLFVPYIKSAHIIYLAHKNKEPVKQINRDILIAPASIGIMGTLGMIYADIPFLSIALTYTCTFLYMNIVEDFVTIDPISTLPNKPEFIDELKHRISIENMRKRDNLYIVVVDILQLKRINDLYGYSEGDNVIRRISNILRRRTALTDKMNMFACRYSGTKYFLILNADRVEDIMSFCTNLQMKINNSNTINLVEYETNVMYGFCKYKEGMHIGDIIDECLLSLDINKLKFNELKKTKNESTQIKET